MAEKQLFFSIIDALKSDETVKALGLEMTLANKLNVGAELGAGSPKEMLKKSIPLVSKEPAGSSIYLPSLKNTSLQLESLFAQHTKRSKWVFGLCIAVLTVAMFLVFSGIWMMFSKSSPPFPDGMFTALTGVCLGILDKFLFNLYQKESEKASAVEADLRLLQNIERQFALIAVIPDQATRNQAYLKIIESVNGQ